MSERPALISSAGPMVQRGWKRWNDPPGHGCSQGPCCSAGSGPPLRGPAARTAVAAAPGRRPRAETAGLAGRRRRRPCRLANGPRADERRGDDPRSPSRPPADAPSADADADRLPVPDQPGHRLAALRRPAADRRRRAGQRLGRRGRADAGQGPLGPHAQHRLRLHPPRRRRPGLQQGHHDRAEHELLLRAVPACGGTPFGIISTTDAIYSPWWPGRS